MKKYLTLAAVLGAIAFISVSYLAQATESVKPEASFAAERKAAPAVAGVVDGAPAATTAASLAETSFKADNDMCTMISVAPTTEGAAPAPAVSDALFKKCMLSKGHTEDELQKEADVKAPPAAPATDADLHPEHNPTAK